jgi:hypothetical protein
LFGKWWPFWVAIIGVLVTAELLDALDIIGNTAANTMVIACLLVMTVAWIADWVVRTRANIRNRDRS